jgi:short-subunit dehydrogenase
MKDLHGKNAIVTGASYGIGPHIARSLGDHGVNVALAARSGEKLGVVADRIAATGARAIAIPTDVTDPLARETLVARAESMLGPIDVLVNNASIHHAGRLDRRTPSQLDSVLSTNLVALIQLTRLVLPKMIRRGSGHIVHVSSIAGKVGIPYLAAYDASKYGVVGFNHGLQAELAGTGVRSSAVCSGFVRDDGMWARMNRRVHPAFGLSSPDRVARAVVAALRHDKVEVIVNPLPVRPVIMLWALWPGLATRVFRWLRINDFMRGTALQVEAEDQVGE